MTRADLHRAWVAQAQHDADRGVIECRVCRRRAGLDETVTLWRNGVLAFAVCDGCAARHDVTVRATAAGIEVRARPRGVLELRTGGG